VAPRWRSAPSNWTTGACIKGFLCESWAAASARDITDFGGWLAFLNQREERHDRCATLSPGVCPDVGGTDGRLWDRPEKSSGDDPKPLVVGFVYIGSKSDYGYNQAHAEGAGAVRKMPGVVVKEEESVPDTMDVQKSMKSMIELNHASVIFPTSFGYYDPHVLRVAALYPNVKFIHCGGLWDEKQHPAISARTSASSTNASIFSGIVAAHATKTKKLGFVAGKAIPQVRRNINAFTMGARSIDPEITCTVIFTGDWSLSVKEAEATLNLIDQGVDVMTCHVNSPKVVIEQAERRGIYTCGYHANQSVLGAEELLTGAEWNWEKVYTDYITKISRRQLDAGAHPRRPERRLCTDVSLWRASDGASPISR